VRSVSSVKNAGELVALVDRVAGGRARELPFGVGAARLRQPLSSAWTSRGSRRARGRAGTGTERRGADARLLWDFTDPSESCRAPGRSEWPVTSKGASSLLAVGAVSSATKAALRASFENPCAQCWDPSTAASPSTSSKIGLMTCFNSHRWTRARDGLHPTDSAASWGSYAGEVFAAAAEGSLIANTVIEGAAGELASLVSRLLARGIVDQARRSRRWGDPDRGGASRPVHCLARHRLPGDVRYGARSRAGDGSVSSGRLT